MAGTDIWLSSASELGLANRALSKPYGSDIYSMMLNYFEEREFTGFIRAGKNRINVSYELIGLLSGLGAVGGVLAGLLGIGGGLLVVPAAYFLLPKAGIPQEFAMQMALATSLSTIIVTSGSSAVST